MFYKINFSKQEILLIARMNSNGTWPEWGTIQKEKKSTINNDNRTEWSAIRSVIIRLINKVGPTRSMSPIC